MLNFFITWAVAILLGLCFLVYVLLVAAQNHLHPRLELPAYSRKTHVAIIAVLTLLAIATIAAVITRFAELS